ncbi:MAG: response regulator [Thiohalomonadales bacterium]
MSDAEHIVLIVDDTPSNIDLLIGILRPDYKVKAATNGEKALQIAKIAPLPDIVLLDIMMPGMSGYEVCEGLKQDPLTAPIPVIFITAKATAEDEQRGLAMGAVDYITKPFNPDIVMARVRAQLALYTASQKLQRENIQLKEKILGGFLEYNENDLHQLVSAGEGDLLEFKSTLRWNLHTDKADKKIENSCLKTIAAYLNSDGGVLLIGVDDAGDVLGLYNDKFSNEDKQLLHWNNLIKAHLGVQFAQVIRATIQSIGEQRIMVVQCLPSPRPVFFSRENDEIFFVRAGNATQQLRPSEVLAYIDQRMA